MTSVTMPVRTIHPRQPPNGFPALDRIQTLLGKHDGAFLVVGAHNQKIHFIADLHQIFGFGVGISGKFRKRNKTGLLAAYIHIHFIRGNTDNHTVNLFVCI